MTQTPTEAVIADVLADPSGAAVCAALLDGRAWTAGELAEYCRPAPTAGRLDRLLAAGVVIDLRQAGRRYFRLATEEVAGRIERTVTRPAGPTPRSRRLARVNDQLQAGRTCYRHPAGRLGVGLTDRLRRRGLLAPDWRLTEPGSVLLAGWGVPAPDRLAGAPCLDFTERRCHLAGPLGTALGNALFGNGWLARVDDSRAARLTPAGQEAFAAAGLGAD